MPYSTIPLGKINQIRKAFIQGQFDGKKMAKALKIHPNTVYAYIRKFTIIKEQFPDKLHDGKFRIPKEKRGVKVSEKYLNLIAYIPEILSDIDTAKMNLRKVHEVYISKYPDGFKYHQFNHYFYDWRIENNMKHLPNKYLMKISPEDQRVLLNWKHSSDHRKWQKAVTILEFVEGKSKIRIADQVGAGCKAVRKWIATFQIKGLEGFDKMPYQYPESTAKRMEEKEINLMKLMHESPALHNINCTTWKITDLSATYFKVYGHCMSRATVAFYLKKQGFRFKKAKKVLTSPDPDFREKLNAVMSILSKLKPDECFFSIDEFGPVSIRMKGGKSLMQNDQVKVFQQVQRSKGCLICTAALELSTNQVTHFYSATKDTKEMIKLIEVLLIKYKVYSKLYLSWDAALWHTSKQLIKFTDVVNSNSYRGIKHTPEIIFAPLPSSAQFLNVIESVFSGLARSVIHNSDYQSVEECKAAIDRYFKERNENFRLHPQKAGKKIWGKEVVKPVFDPSHNCKDPRNR